MRILFMGTPTFAEAALIKLAESEFGKDIVGVVTKVDTPKNRGQKLLPSPVKETAIKLGLPVFQPETLKDGAFSKELSKLAPDVIIVAAYGKILPRDMLDMPRFGCINIHGSLLPKYRGAAPIQRAIMDGEKEIGVTIMQMADGIDTGDTFLSRSLTFENESFGEIYASLASLGGDMMVEVLRKLENGGISPQKQDDSAATYAKKIEKEECVIDFTLPAKNISDKIRALSPAPCAVTHIGEKLLKISKATYLQDETSGECGEITAVSPKGDGYIDIKTGNGTLRVLRLVPEGKKEMSAGDFLRGRGAEVGNILN